MTNLKKRTDVTVNNYKGLVFKSIESEDVPEHTATSGISIYQNVNIDKTHILQKFSGDIYYQT